MIQGLVNNGGAAMVTIEGETTQALAVNFTSGTPTIDNFTLINSTPFVVEADGLLKGSFNWDPVISGEGDIGGMILVITPIPEPSTWLLLTGGVSLLAVLRRRCR
ncbi:MAG: PEP-CTERM sorting domain-containing protein [Verrucomicrobiales bacterium]|nr:PEP-CTERM sorting domain-containing protein [Verrucomicrobiales bacterium]